MKFDDHFIDQVRNTVNLVDLVGGYVRLKKSGQNFAGLCPFHNEKTPSFLVSDTKQIFKCFGCGAGGDVFGFIMQIENLSFPDAIHYLAERQGIPVPQSSQQSAVYSQQRGRLLKMMEVAVGFFRNCLQQNQSALAYLRDRQITSATIDQFQIGFAPGRNELLGLLQKQSFTPEEALQCGLVVEKEGGGYYDKFRQRIMFPIHDLSGRVIALGGRVLGDGVPKYLNSPETLLYKKGSNLYGLYVSRGEIRRRDFAILVEGYFDCIVPFQFGIRNTVASLGTSLTENQVKILGRYSRNVIVNFDPDSAGVAAAMRSIDLFLEQGIHVNVVQLPAGQDPDTFLRREGAPAYEENLKASVPYLEFLLDRFIRDQKDPSNPKGKQAVVSRILPYLQKIANRIERAEYVSRIASRLRIDANLLISEMRKTAPRREKSPPGQSVVSILEQPTPAEVTLLHCLLDEQLSSLVAGTVDEELFEGLRTATIFQLVLAWRKQNQTVSIVKLRASLKDADDQHLLDSIALQDLSTPLSEELLQNSVQALRRKQYERLSRQIQEEIQEAESDDPGKIADLLAKKEKIRKQIELNLV